MCRQRAGLLVSVAQGSALVYVANNWLDIGYQLQSLFIKRLQSKAYHAFPEPMQLLTKALSHSDRYKATLMNTDDERNFFNVNIVLVVIGSLFSGARNPHNQTFEPNRPNVVGDVRLFSLVEDFDLMQVVNPIFVFTRCIFVNKMTNITNVLYQTFATLCFSSGSSLA